MFLSQKYYAKRKFEFNEARIWQISPISGARGVPQNTIAPH